MSCPGPVRRQKKQEKRPLPQHVLKCKRHLFDSDKDPELEDRASALEKKRKAQKIKDFQDQQYKVNQCLQLQKQREYSERHTQDFKEQGEPSNSQASPPQGPWPVRESEIRGVCPYPEGTPKPTKFH